MPDQGDAAAVVVHYESPSTLRLTLTDLGEVFARDPHGAASAVWSEGGRLSFPLRYPEHVRAGRTHGTRCALWVDGAAFVIAVRTWQRVGGLPEEFFLSLEDVALGLACRRLAEPVVVVLDAVVEHAAVGPSRYLAIRNRLILADGYFSRLDSAVVHATIYATTVLLALRGRRGHERALESRQAIGDARRVKAAAAARPRLPPRERPQRDRAWRSGWRR